MRGDRLFLSVLGQGLHVLCGREVVCGLGGRDDGVAQLLLQLVAGGLRIVESEK